MPTSASVAQQRKAEKEKEGKRMGKKKGKKNEDESNETSVAQQSTLADFLEFPSLGGVSEALPASRPDSPAPQSFAEHERVPPPNKHPPQRPPPEQHFEELVARHKKEKRELEGAARAARKAAGKNKAKLEAADAAAERALQELSEIHESEVLGLQLRIEQNDDAQEEPALSQTRVCGQNVVGLKGTLTAQVSRGASDKEVSVICTYVCIARVCIARVST